VTLKTAASVFLSTANPFIVMVLRWLSTLAGYSGRMNMFVALSFGLIQQVLHNPQ